MKAFFLFLFVFFSSLSIFAQTTVATITLVADNSNIPYGGSTTLHWNSNNTTSLYGNGGTGNDLWPMSGPKQNSGSFYTGVLLATTTYGLYGVNSITHEVVTAYFTVYVQPQPFLFIQGRAVGAGTFVSFPIIGNTYSINGFELKIQKSPLGFSPINFYLGDNFWRMNWIESNYINTDSSLHFIAVGDPVNYYNNDFNLGNLYMFVPANLSGSVVAGLNMQAYDGTNSWIIEESSCTVINLPRNSYGDLNADGKRDVSDAILSFQMNGVPSSLINDTLRIKDDLSGDGIPNTYDTYLEFNLINDPNAYMPIWQNYQYGNCCGKLTAVTATWQKMPNNKWGLYTDEKITNGDLVQRTSINNITSSASMFKKVDKNIYFVEQAGISGNPILIADTPVELTGTVNEGRTLVINSTTGVAEEKKLPTTFKLNQNYPNPFNPSTKISFAIPTSGFVTLRVYDILGKEVATLVNEEKSTGIYEATFNASNLPSGVYIYRIQSGSFIQTKKMSLMK